MQERTLSHSFQICNFLLSILSDSLSVPATFQVLWKECSKKFYLLRELLLSSTWQWACITGVDCSSSRFLLQFLCHIQYQQDNTERANVNQKYLFSQPCLNLQLAVNMFWGFVSKKVPWLKAYCRWSCASVKAKVCKHLWNNSLMFCLNFPWMPFSAHLW